MNLPELPEPRTRGPSGNALYDRFDMENYARAALALAKSAEPAVSAPEPVVWLVTYANGEQDYWPRDPATAGLDPRYDDMPSKVVPLYAERSAVPESDEWTGNCTVCRRPVLYGSRHHHCGSAVMEAYERGKAEALATLKSGMPPLPKPDRPNIWGGCYSKEAVLQIQLEAARAALKDRT